MSNPGRKHDPLLGKSLPDKERTWMEEFSTAAVNFVSIGLMPEAFDSPLISDVPGGEWTEYINQQNDAGYHYVNLTHRFTRTKFQKCFLDCL